MLDTITTASVTAAGSNRAVHRAGPREGAPAQDGRNTPADGRDLPVAPVKVEIVELPELERLAENITRFARSMNRDLSFSVHEASGQTVVTVLDGETREVIRQIPSEEFLHMSEALANGRAGLLDTEA